MTIVRFNYADVPVVQLKKKRELKEFILFVFRNEGKAVKSVNYIFCSDNYLRRINKSFLKHDFFTDIVTFDLSESDETIGEVYISIDRVKENSVVYDTKYRQEMLRVMFHGALHLIGYGDKKKSEITVMREKEEYYLRLFESK